jgi:hypothetical protein
MSLAADPADPAPDAVPGPVADPDLAAALRALGVRLTEFEQAARAADGDLARQIAACREAAAQTTVVMAAHRGQLGSLKRRMDDAGLDTLADRFDQLVQTVQAVLDAAAPRGPAAPRWDDGVDDAQRQQQLDALRDWVERELRPGYVVSGCYELAGCWDQHPVALRELSAVAVWWRFIFVRSRPDTALALEWHDRWLPGAMRRVAEATKSCTMGHGGPL